MRKIIAIGLTVAMLAMAGTAMASGSNTLTVQANVSGTCKFVSAASTLGFGALDPSDGSDVPGSTTTNYWCTKGVPTATVTANNGAHYSGTQRQMAGPAGEMIPYSLDLTLDINPNLGPGTPRSLTISGEVLGTDYISKMAGDYSDTVTLNITP